MQKLKTYTFSVVLNIILIVIVLLGLAFIFVQPNLSNLQGSSFNVQRPSASQEEAFTGAVTIEYNYDDFKINDQKYIIGSFNVMNDYEPILVYGLNLELEGEIDKENLNNLELLIDKEKIEDVEFSWKGESSLIVDFAENPIEINGLSRIEIQAQLQEVNQNESLKVHFININSEGLKTGRNISNIGVLGGPEPTPKTIKF